MDYVCWRHPDGCSHTRWCHVPSVATNSAFGCLVYQYGDARTYRPILRNRYCAVDFLHHHCHRCQSWYMDISPIVRWCWVCEFSFLSHFMIFAQFVPGRSIRLFLHGNGTSLRKSPRRRRTRRERRRRARKTARLQQRKLPTALKPRSSLFAGQGLRRFPTKTHELVALDWSCLLLSLVIVDHFYPEAIEGWN